MVLFDPDRRWQRQAICQDVKEAERLFFAPGGQLNRSAAKATQGKWDQAKEICAMCPVLAECRRDTLGEQYGVWGGLDEHQRYLIRKRLSSTVKRWPRERQLAWGEKLLEMRESGLQWRTVQDQCGITPTAAMWLVDQWLEERPGPQAQVVDLPLPQLEPVAAYPPFPDRRGGRHLWARHNRMVTDCWYRGQTADGEWFRVETWAGRGRSVNKWVHKDSVQVYEPQPVVIMNYAGRPDAPAA